MLVGVFVLIQFGKWGWMRERERKRERKKEREAGREKRHARMQAERGM